MKYVFPAHQPDPPETADGRWNKHAVGRFPFAGPTEIPESMLMDQVVTTESLSWLLEFADQRPDQPWFFRASYSRPHFPLTAPGRYFRKYLSSELRMSQLSSGYPEDLHPQDRFIVDDFSLMQFSQEEHRRALAGYYALVDYVDDCIGSLLEGLRQAGCLENTYVVYTTDHGNMAGEHDLWWKRTYYEASARIPMLISGPGIEGCRAVSTPVELVDLFPTFCHWAEMEVPSELNGESLVPLLKGQPEQREKKTVRSELLGGNVEMQFQMIRDERWKYVEFSEAGPRLFDLASDPTSEAPVGELRDLLADEGTFETIGEMREKDRQRSDRPASKSKGALQYRLANGRIIEADAALYGDKDLK